MPTVSMRKCTSYDRAGQAIIAALEDLGGMERFISPGDSVLIKPNMLGAYNPDRHVTTHPSVVRAVAEMVLDCRGKPIIWGQPRTGPLPSGLPEDRHRRGRKGPGRSGPSPDRLYTYQDEKRRKISEDRAFTTGR